MHGAFFQSSVSISLLINHNDAAAQAHPPDRSTAQLRGAVARAVMRGVRPHKMPQRSIRFAIRTDDGRTSDIWKCWTTTGTGKRDVYMTSRPLGNALKLSLHEGGQWHVAFDAKKKGELFDPDSAPPTRFLGKWQRPSAGTDPFVLGARVLFPWSCPMDTPIVGPADTVWIPCAPERQIVEVAIFLLNVEIPDEDWPGKRAMETNLVGRLPLEGGGQVAIVRRTYPMWDAAPSKRGTMNYFRDKSMADLPEANRMVAWGEEADGSITFLESRLVVSGSSAA